MSNAEVFNKERHTSAEISSSIEFALFISMKTCGLLRCWFQEHIVYFIESNGVARSTKKSETTSAHSLRRDELRPLQGALCQRCDGAVPSYESYLNEATIVSTWDRNRSPSDPRRGSVSKKIDSKMTVEYRGKLDDPAVVSKQRNPRVEKITRGLIRSWDRRSRVACIEMHW